MPAPMMKTVQRHAVMAILLATASTAWAQTRPLPSVEAVPTPPLQREALAVFRPQAEQLCQALYLRPDAVENCLQRVLDAALPLDLAPVMARPREGNSRPEPRGSTVAPDGRE